MDGPVVAQNYPQPGQAPTSYQPAPGYYPPTTGYYPQAPAYYQPQQQQQPANSQENAEEKDLSFKAWFSNANTFHKLMFFLTCIASIAAPICTISYNQKWASNISYLKDYDTDFYDQVFAPVAACAASLVAFVAGILVAFVFKNQYYKGVFGFNSLMLAGSACVGFLTASQTHEEDKSLTQIISSGTGSFCQNLLFFKALKENEQGNIAIEILKKLIKASSKVTNLTVHDSTWCQDTTTQNMIYSGILVAQPILAVITHFT